MPSNSFSHFLAFLCPCISHSPSLTTSFCPREPTTAHHQGLPELTPLPPSLIPPTALFIPLSTPVPPPCHCTLQRSPRASFTRTNLPPDYPPPSILHPQIPDNVDSGENGGEERSSATTMNRFLNLRHWVKRIKRGIGMPSTTENSATAPSVIRMRRRLRRESSSTSSSHELHHGPITYHHSSPRSSTSSSRPSLSARQRRRGLWRRKMMNNDDGGGITEEVLAKYRILNERRVRQLTLAGVIDVPHGVISKEGGGTPEVAPRYWSVVQGGDRGGGREGETGGVSGV